MVVFGTALTGTRNVNLVPSGATASISSPDLTLCGILTVTCRGAELFDTRPGVSDGGTSTKIVLPAMVPGGTLHLIFAPFGAVT